MTESSVKVLMVEDQQRHHAIYETAIKNALPLATVDFASDGEEALSAINNGSTDYDLILLDLNIPKIHGSEVLANIRAQPDLDEVPVIILTGDSGHELQTQLLEKGADDFIEKGCPPEIFAARLKAQMRHRLALNRLAEMAVDMDVFTSGVLHDIKNVETTISALCDLTKMSLDDDPIANREKIDKDIESIRGQAHRISEYASSIIQNLRSARGHVQLQSIAIKPLVEWVEQLLEADTAELDNLLTWTIPQPLVNVMADGDLLRLAVVNILQNAVRYSREGVPCEVEITQTFTEDRKRVQTRFRDNGIGVAEIDLRKIFQPFVKASDNRGCRSGFGLGLALVNRVIRKNGGKVWAELPSDGKPGSIFCIELACG